MIMSASRPFSPSLACHFSFSRVSFKNADSEGWKLKRDEEKEILCKLKF